MKKSQAFIALILLLVGAGCSSTFHSSTARTRNVNESGMLETANIADLKVDEQKITGTATGANMTETTAKNLAVYDALKKVGADVLIEPTYETDRTGNSITVTVHGYPGFYKKFRKPTEQDLLIIGVKH